MRLFAFPRFSRCNLSFLLPLGKSGFFPNIPRRVGPSGRVVATVTILTGKAIVSQTPKSASPAAVFRAPRALVCGAHRPCRAALGPTESKPDRLSAVAARAARRIETGDLPRRYSRATLTNGQEVGHEGFGSGRRIPRGGAGRRGRPGRRVAAADRVGSRRRRRASPRRRRTGLGPIVARVDDRSGGDGPSEGLAPALAGARAGRDAAAVARRSAGRSPRWRRSAGSSPGRPGVGSTRWLDDLLRDRRSADYLAERFARAFVGTEDGPFLKFRRRRFVSWLSDAILANRPYDAIVRDLIADDGLWTDHPATNFLTVTIDEKTERPTPDRLSARVSRAFLGVRLDCAQCHDHPFQPWKQEQFRGLAAFFGGTHSQPPRHPRQRERLPAPGPQGEGAADVVEPRVPFLARAAAGAGGRRPARPAGRLGHRPAEPEPRPRHGQPRLGPPVRPAAGRAGGRPARRRRSSTRP